MPVFPGYQVSFAESIRREASIATGAVGMVRGGEMAEEILRNGRADLVVVGRSILGNPHWPLEAARELGVSGDWPLQYERARIA